MANEWHQNLGRAAGALVEVPLKFALKNLDLTARELIRARRTPRALLAAALLGGVAVHYGEPYAKEKWHSMPGIEHFMPRVPHFSWPIGNNIPTPEVTVPQTTEVYADKNANEALKKYGMHAGSFFKFDEKVLNKLTAFKSEQLLPIYPPAVIAQKEHIYNAAQKNHVSPNIIAMIMSIESAGDPDAGSEADAQGLMQVLPDKFDPSIQNDKAAMRKPALNVDVGTEYFVKQCIPNAVADLSGKYDKDKASEYAIVIAKAAVFYNAGPNRIGQRFDELPDEAKFYGDHIMRYMLTAQIAGELRQLGYTDARIVKALESLEIDSRAHALGEFHRRNSGKYFYSTYDKQLDPLGVIQLTKGNPYFDEYEEYKRNPYGKVPLNAATRIHTQIGGLSLLQKVPSNSRPKDWYDMDTKRN